MHRGLLAPEEAREGLALLRSLVEPTPTGAGLARHRLDIGMAVDHLTYDTLYVAFAIATGARAVVAADERFIQRIGPISTRP